MAEDRLRFIIDAQARLAGLKEAEKRLAALGGPAAVKAQKALNKVNRELKLVGGEAKKSNILFSRFTQGIAAGNIIANLAGKAVQALGSAIKEVGKSILVAGEVQELGLVYEFVGKKAGFTTEQLNSYRESLLKNGIAQKAANQSLLRGLQAQIKLTDVVKLGKIAQDAATIGQVDSSEAHVRLLNAVAKLQPRLLKELGIIVNLNNVYPKFAQSIGKATNELTDAERKQALLNEIFLKAEAITGAYEVAMNSASKRLRSLNRLFQDAQVAIGQAFQPELMLAVRTAELFLKVVADVGKQLANDKTFDKEGVETLTGKIVELGSKTGALARVVIGTGRLWIATFKIMKDAVDLTILPVTNLVEIFAKLALKDFSGALDAVKNFKSDVTDEFLELQLSMADFALAGFNIKQGLEDLETTAPVAGTKLANAFKAAIPPALDFKEIVEGIDQEVKLFSVTAPAELDKTKIGFDRLASAAQNFFSIIGRGKLSFGSFLSLARQFVGLLSGLGVIGGAAGAITNVAGAVVGGGNIGGAGNFGGVTPVAGGTNITGNVTVVTQANNVVALAREIENLSSRNLTSVRTDIVEIQR